LFNPTVKKIMSLFPWFSKKKSASPIADAQSSGLGHVDATVPFTHSGRGHPKATDAPGIAANRKNERLERRELLYSVVRESMTRVGVLSSSYKFKVLSLDSRGRQYLIMMDLVRLHDGEAGRLAEIEALIAQSAKSRHDILVTSVYWRVSEHVTAGLTRKPPPVSAPAPLTAHHAENHGPAMSAKPRYEPLQPDEVAAFKNALASAPSAASLSSPGQIVHSGRRNPAPMPTFADTELDDRATPLSGTQYGDLN
jgi:hypothetical protein